MCSLAHSSCSRQSREEQELTETDRLGSGRLFYRTHAEFSNMLKVSAGQANYHIVCSLGTKQNSPDVHSESRDVSQIFWIYSMHIHYNPPGYRIVLGILNTKRI